MSYFLRMLYFSDCPAFSGMLYFLRVPPPLYAPPPRGSKLRDQPCGPVCENARLSIAAEGLILRSCPGRAPARRMLSMHAKHPARRCSSYPPPRRAGGASALPDPPPPRGGISVAGFLRSRNILRKYSFLRKQNIWVPGRGIPDRVSLLAQKLALGPFEWRSRPSAPGMWFSLTRAGGTPINRILQSNLGNSKKNPRILRLTCVHTYVRKDVSFTFLGRPRAKNVSFTFSQGS